MVHTEYTDHRTAAAVSAKYHLESGRADLHFQNEGKNLLVVTITLEQLKLLYHNIDADCRKEGAPFPPVKGK